MRRSFKEVILKSLRTREAWVIFFVLGIIMMNYPFMSIFNKAAFFFELPVLYLYLQLGWVISICVIFIFTKANHLTNGNDTEKGEHR